MEHNHDIEWTQREFDSIKQLIREGSEASSREIAEVKRDVKDGFDKMNGRVRKVEGWMTGVKMTVGAIILLLAAKFRAIFGL